MVKTSRWESQRVGFVPFTHTFTHTNSDHTTQIGERMAEQTDRYSKWRYNASAHQWGCFGTRCSRLCTTFTEIGSPARYIPPFGRVSTIASANRAPRSRLLLALSESSEDQLPLLSWEGLTQIRRSQMTPITVLRSPERYAAGSIGFR